MAHSASTSLAPTTAALATTTPPWLDRTLYPFASHWHDTPHGRMHVVDEGRGSPILFVHGTPSWSFEWRHQITALRGEHRCIAPDHLGFGLSDKPPGAPLQPADHAARLRDLVRALDLHDVTLVVHDFGGPIGLPLVFDEPDRIARVVVMNTWMWAHGDDPRIHKLSRFVASGFGRWLYLRLNASPRWLVPMSFADRRKLTPTIHQHYMRPFATRDERMGPWTLGCALAGADAWYDAQWRHRAALQGKPMTIVWGDRDPAFGAGYLAKWREAMPHAEVITIDGAGHFPQEEEPERVTAAIRRAMR